MNNARAISLCLGFCAALCAAACITQSTPDTLLDSGNGGGTGGGAAGGSAGGGAGGSGGSAGGGAGGGSDGGAATAFCDGFSATDSSSTHFDVQTFAFGNTLTAEGCAATVNAYADGVSLNAVAGIFDLDTGDNGVGAPAPALLVGNCSDLGLPGFTPTSSTITPPSGALTIAAAYGSTVAGITIYGVVTAVDAWGINATTSVATAGSIYIQDATPTNAAPAIKSGSEVYFSKANEAVYGTAPSVGDVVAVSGVTWSPYQGVNEFAASATTVVTKLGTAPLPTPVSITATQATQSAYLTSSGYEGMRVTVSGGPFTVHGSATSNTCPTQLEYTPPAGTGGGSGATDGGTDTGDGGVGTITTIAAARAANMTTPITVTAVVTGLHGSPGDYSQWYIEDPAGGPNSGVAVYCDPDLTSCPTLRAPALYSLVQITGSLSTYMGLLQFVPTAQTVLQANATPPPVAEVTMADVAEQGTSAYRGVYVSLSSTHLTVDELTPAALLDTQCTAVLSTDAGSFGEPLDGGLYACSPPCSPPAYSGFQANDGAGHEVYIENFFFYTEHLQNSPECFTQPGMLPVSVGQSFTAMSGILDWDSYGSAQALYPVQDSDYTIAGSGGGAGGGAGGGTAGGTGGGAGGGTGGGTAGGTGGGAGGGAGGGSGSALSNGDFENGLTGWTTTGTVTSSSVAESGVASAQVGSTTATATSSVAQTFTVPAGASTLTFWYQGVCNDTVAYAWATATLLDNTTSTTATLLANTCTKTGQWVQVTSAALTAGHSMTLTLTNKGEVYQSDYNYTLFDNVQLTGTGG